MRSSFERFDWLPKSWALIPVIALHIVLGAIFLQRQPLFIAQAAAPLEVTFTLEKAPSVPDWQPPAPVVSLNFDQLVRVPAPEVQVAVAASAITAKTFNAPAPVAEPSPPGPKLMSDVEYLRQPELRYPKASRRLREQGTVVLRVWVDETGHASQIDVHRSSGFQRLDEAACRAVRDAQFKPYVYDGRAQAALVMVPIEFSLRV